MKLSLISTFILLFLNYCHDEIKVPENPSNLFSKWNWEISTGGIAGTSYTPESTGDQLRIEFNADSVYREYLNGQLVFETKFQVIQAKSIYQTEPVFVIIYQDRSVGQSFKIQNKNLLILYDEVYDGFAHQYYRIQNEEMKLK